MSNKKIDTPVDEIIQLAEDLYYKGFTGISDEGSVVSLLDYGFLWDTITETAIFYNQKTFNPRFEDTEIRVEEITNRLRVLGGSFYDYADLSMDKTPSGIVKDRGIPKLIHDINSFNGSLYPKPLSDWEMTAEDVREKYLK